MKKLKAIRENAGLSRRDLSRLIGIKEARYGHYENGRRISIISYSPWYNSIEESD